MNKTAYDYLRPWLFKLDPEHAHEWTLRALNYMPSGLFKPASHNPVQTLGLHFPHRIGLAAGLDKNGSHIDALAKLGFAFIEIGTVTPRAQFGNPKPRLFRLPKAEAIINRMGFNNEGVDVLVKNVQKSSWKGILGINIGKNKETPIVKAAEDYLLCLNKVYPYASYITINISSPNTPDLRQLQQAEYIRDLLALLRTEQLFLRDKYKREVPMLLKLSPDEEFETLKHIASVVVDLGIEGIIATNTTCSRQGLEGLAHANEQGGLSGKPLLSSATKTLQLLKQETGNAAVLIGVGGIDSPEAARGKLAAGAELLQIYTGLIYKGPELVRVLSAV